MVDYVVVASHYRYSEARGRLLRSLWGQGVPRGRVVVVLNGAEKDDTGPDPEGYTVVCFGSNLYEYSAFLVPRVLGSGPDDAFLLLHDTSLACDGFGLKAAQAFGRFREEGVDILWCSSTGQCNLCVFGLVACDMARSLWASRRELDKRHAIEMEHCPDAEGSIKGATALRQSYVQEPTQQQGIDWPYSSGHERAVLFFPFLDVKKFYYDMDRWSEHPNRP